VKRASAGSWSPNARVGRPADDGSALFKAFRALPRQIFAFEACAWRGADPANALTNHEKPNQRRRANLQVVEPCRACRCKSDGLKLRD
jgi:hypothetical protein